MRRTNWGTLLACLLITLGYPPPLAGLWIPRTGVCVNGDYLDAREGSVDRIGVPHHRIEVL